MTVYLERRPPLSWHPLLVFTCMVAACGPADGKGQEAKVQASSPAESEGATVKSSTSAPTDSVNWAAVDDALGRKGQMQPGGVYKYAMPRNDLQVSSRGVQIKPALSLGSWLAFKPKAGGAVAMGDLVLTEKEYNGVIARLQQGGVGQTAVHKHLPEQTPAIWWTHVHAEGDPVKIAQTVKAALALTATPTQVPPSPDASSVSPKGIDTAAINQALGRSGKVSGGVYQVSIPRAEKIHASEIEVPGSMGTATALNFQPTGGGKAAINGDFVMIAAEVQPVIAALKDNAIQVVTIHNHMVDEEPRLFFIHFWANDDAVKLAHGLRAALDRTNSARAKD